MRPRGWPNMPSSRVAAGRSWPGTGSFGSIGRQPTQERQDRTGWIDPLAIAVFLMKIPGHEAAGSRPLPGRGGDRVVVVRDQGPVLRLHLRGDALPAGQRPALRRDPRPDDLAGPRRRALRGRI